VARGRHLVRDAEVEGELAFWGEWEPPSHIERSWSSDARRPRVLHRPHWGDPTPASRFRQNTDPWVWGETMMYSNCKQVVTPSMKKLTIGSVICFGSTIGGQFCVDTVFVVGSSKEWRPRDATPSDVDEAFITCTAGSLASHVNTSDQRLTLYRGATFEDPVEGMFSFVPARLTDDEDPRFERPAIHIPDFINPANRQSTLGSKRELPISAVRDAWLRVRDQVLDQDLVLATHIATPEKRGTCHISAQPGESEECTPGC
jgi:hypothetical protein